MLTSVWVLVYRVYIHYQNLLVDLYDLIRVDLNDLVQESAEAWNQPRLTLDSLRADYEAFKQRERRHQRLTNALVQPPFCPHIFRSTNERL